MNSRIYILALLPTVVVVVNAFQVVPGSLRYHHTTNPSTTRRFLEDWVADLIDGELYREEHKKEFEVEWMKKNKNAILHSMSAARDDGQLGEGTTDLMMEDANNYRMKAKDRNLAASDPQRYCADRCIATGNCDIYEDFFDMSAQEVIKFCKDCVLSDGEEPCEIPEAFYDVYASMEDEDFGNLKP